MLEASVMYGTKSDIEFVEKCYNKTSNPNLKRMLINALASSQNPNVLLRFV